MCVLCVVHEKQIKETQLCDNIVVGDPVGNEMNKLTSEGNRSASHIIKDNEQK
jgi:hypothetical protein